MLQIGEQIKRLRNIKKMSLTELSTTSGVQIATLSRMEHGRMTGTVASHMAIARALGVDLTDFYQTLPSEPLALVAAGDKLEVVAAPNEKVTSEILARQIASKRMLPALIRIAGKGTATTAKGIPGTERFIYVLEGSVLLKIKDQEIKLKAGASLYFPAAQEHVLENPLSSAAKILSVTTPVNL